MSQSEQWANQRLALLRNHVQEQKGAVIQEAQTREELVSKHQIERDHIRPRTNAVEWTYYLTKHTESLIDLFAADQQQWQNMRNRQEQEVADLEARIDMQHEGPNPDSSF